MSAELQKAQFQLAQVEASLRSDPENAELLSIAEGLREYISITEQIVAASAGAAGAAGAADGGEAGGARGGASSAAGGSVRPHQFKPGDLCEAIYSQDGRWYVAEVQAVSKDGLIYTVMYEGYNESAVVKATSVRTISKEALKRRADEQEAAEQAKLDERKKVKREKNKAFVERSKEAENEIKAKQSTWQKFAQKKAKVVPGVSQKSIFASPDTLEGRVGVVGSGKGTTDYGKRKKHEFSVDDGSNA